MLHAAERYRIVPLPRRLTGAQGTSLAAREPAAMAFHLKRRRGIGAQLGRIVRRELGAAAEELGRDEADGDGRRK
jgi:hypothetical protein